MIDAEELKNRAMKCHFDVFGETPLYKRLEDIVEEAYELDNYTSQENLKEETSDLLSSLMCLAAEHNWTLEELIKMNEDKLVHRKAIGYYKE